MVLAFASWVPPIAASQLWQLEEVELSRPELGRRVKMGFEVVGGELAAGGRPAFGVVISEIMADFQPRFRKVAAAAPVEQFGFEATPNRFSGG